MVASAPDRIRARVLFVALLAMIGWVHALFAGNADSFGLQRRLPSLEQLTVKGSVPHRAVAAPMAAAQTAASAPICDLFANGSIRPGPRSAPPVSTMLAEHLCGRDDRQRRNRYRLRRR